MTKAEQARHIARLFDDRRDDDAYHCMEYMLREREWPGWLTQTAGDIDSVTKEKADG